MNTPITQHTPGPWTHTPGQDTVWARDGELLVARTDYTRGRMAINEDEANARLIAASPEMLAALESAALTIRDLSKQLADLGVVPDQGWKAFRAARDIVAKAKGGAK